MASTEGISATNTTSPTAVFIGATSGIGLGAIKALLQGSKSPKVIIVGRSQAKFAPTLSELQKLNVAAELTFIEAQVSLLKEVSRICDNIIAQQSSIDILWLSQGGMSLSDHELTTEGLNATFAVNYYSRILFMHKLLPLLAKSADARVISVLTAGHEGAIITSDFGVTDPKNNSFFPAMRQSVSMMSLSMRELALQNPKISFMHTNPGLVSSNVHDRWAKTMTGYLTPLSWLVKWVFIPLRDSFGITSDEAGRRGFYMASSEKFASAGGVNFFRLNPDAREEKSSKVLDNYVEEGMGARVWQHTLEVFERVLA